MAVLQSYDVVILGGGAAGLMAAARAGQRGRRVLVLERGAQLGAKILISGGGRCNFTNLYTAPERFISANPDFCRSALKTYTQHDFIALVSKHKITYHEKTLGQLFCDGSARAILTMLLDECRAGDVTIRTEQALSDVSCNNGFALRTQDALFHAPALILATGGLSIPKLGATDCAHRLAQQFGLELVAPSPGLVPMTFGGGDLDFMRALVGIAPEIIAGTGKARFRENMVFTHRGLSGPAILQISSYWRDSMPITIDLLPDLDVVDFVLTRKKQRPQAMLKTILAEILPQRLAQAWVERDPNADNRAVAALSDQYLRTVAAALKNWTLVPTGTEGYGKAEVTTGGVDTRALSSKTMMVKNVQGLYIIGEALDVTGWLGGYNFQWAWSSGWAAGSAV